MICSVQPSGKIGASKAHMFLSQIMAPCHEILSGGHLSDKRNEDHDKGTELNIHSIVSCEKQIQHILFYHVFFFA